jgi:hypothetical protein
MKKMSYTNWVLGLFEKHSRLISYVIRVLIVILLILYVSYFVRFGIIFSQRDMHPLKMLLMGLLFPALAIIIFFIMHFSGGVDFSLKLVGLPIGLAIGGTVIGLISGLIPGPKGWLVGCLIGGIIVTLTMWFYLGKERTRRK